MRSFLRKKTDLERTTYLRYPGGMNDVLLSKSTKKVNKVVESNRERFDTGQKGNFRNEME